MNDLSKQKMKNVKVYPFGSTNLKTLNSKMRISKTQSLQREPQDKVFIFDIDETIGSFSDFIPLWNMIKLKMKMKTQLDPSIFNKLMDLYPEFLRKDILTIMKFILQQKIKRKCTKIYIYTNNIFSPEFPDYIQSYIDYCLNTTGFIDDIIYAYNVSGFVIDSRRTTNEKTLADFWRCSGLDKNTQICYLDDQYYPKMIDTPVFYIHPKPYISYLKRNVIQSRFFKSSIYRDLFGNSRIPSSFNEHPFNHILRSHTKTYKRENNKKTRSLTRGGSKNKTRRVKTGGILSKLISPNPIIKERASLSPISLESIHTKKETLVSKNILYYVKLFFRL